MNCEKTLSTKKNPVKNKSTEKLVSGCFTPTSGEFPASVLKNRKSTYTQNYKNWVSQANIQKLLIKSNAYNATKQVCTCGHYPLPEFVPKKLSDGDIVSVPTGMPGTPQVHQYDTTSHGIIGMKRCANSFFCPVCASKILSFRRDEIEHIGNCMLKNGYQILFLTHTAPHEYSTTISYKDSISRFRAAQADLTMSRGYAQLKKQYGIKYGIKAIEITLDNYKIRRLKTGIHYHTHTVLFLDRKEPISEVELITIKKTMSKLWFSALKKVAYNNSNISEYIVLRHGIDVRCPWLKNEGQISDSETIKRLSKYICKSISFELSSKNTKEARKEGRISLYDYLDMLASDKETSEDILLKERKRLKNITEALKKLPRIYYYPGLKVFCGLENIEDNKIIEGKKEKLRYEFHYNEYAWVSMIRGGRKGRLLRYFNETIWNIDIDVSNNDTDTHAMKLLLYRNIDPLTGEELNE